MSTTIFVSFPVNVIKERLPEFLKFAKKKGIQCLEPLSDEAKYINTNLNYKTDWDRPTVVLRFKDTAKYDFINDTTLGGYLDLYRQGLLFVKMRYQGPYDTRFTFYYMNASGTVNPSGFPDTELTAMPHTFSALLCGINRTNWDHMGKSYPQPPK